MRKRSVMEARKVIANDNERVQAPVRSSQVKLPKIELPTFNSKYEELHVFFDLFNSLIHSNRDTKIPLFKIIVKE